jgi:hypothetical protein
MIPANVKDAWMEPIAESSETSEPKSTIFAHLLQTTEIKHVYL